MSPLALSPGPSPPTPPTDLTVLSVDHQAATLEWTVTNVAYNNESYLVTYGRDPSMLVNSSAVIMGSTVITVQNRVSGCGLWVCLYVDHTPCRGIVCL